MPTKQIAAKSLFLTDTDIPDLFHAVVRARAENEWHNALPAVDEKERLRIDRMKYYERVFSDEKILITKTRKAQHLDANATLASLLFAVTRFADHLTPGALEARIQKLEVALQGIHRAPPASLERDSAASFAIALARAKTLLPAVSSTFLETHGVEPRTVTLSPVPDEEHTVLVEIDASSADPVALEKVRIEGARKRFYELLLDRMSPDDFDLLSFEFNFPAL